MRVDLGLADRTVIVTGGSSGVGLAVVRLLLDEDARVVTCGRDAGRLQAALTQLGAPEGRIASMPCDVRDRDGVERLIALARDSFGGVDGLVNNAGRSLLRPFAETTDEDWRAELELKFAGVLNTTRAALPLLRRSPSPAIVNVNAVLAKQPETRLVATSAARAGLLNLSKSLAAEFAPDRIRVNSVCLGVIDTGQWRRRYEQSGSELDYDAWAARLAESRGIGLGRLGRAEEVASVITMLLSPRTSYVTGTSVDIDGGVNRHAF